MDIDVPTPTTRVSTQEAYLPNKDSRVSSGAERKLHFPTSLRLDNFVVLRQFCHTFEDLNGSVQQNF